MSLGYFHSVTWTNFPHGWSHFYHVEIEFITLTYKLKLQKLDFWPIKSPPHSSLLNFQTHSSLSKSLSNFQTHSSLSKSLFLKLSKSFTQTPKSVTLTMKHFHPQTLSSFRHRTHPNHTETLSSKPSLAATHSDS